MGSSYPCPTGHGVCDDIHRGEGVWSPVVCSPLFPWEVAPEGNLEWRRKHLSQEDGSLLGAAVKTRD